MSAPKAIGKGAAKRKADGKDERSSKKASGREASKKAALPKHEADKGLMTTPSPITQDSECCLLTSGKNNTRVPFVPLTKR